MPLDSTLLRVAVADPAVATLSDADAAVALSTPVKTPRQDRITYTTLAAVWGPVIAATFLAKLSAAIAQANPLAGYVDKLLSGPGFDAGNAATAPTAAQLVAAQLATAEQVDAVLYLTSFRCGVAVSEADVATARAANARQARFDVIRAKVTQVYGAWMNDVLNAAESDPSKPVPTYADFMAAAQAGGE